MLQIVVSLTIVIHDSNMFIPQATRNSRKMCPSLAKLEFFKKAFQVKEFLKHFSKKKSLQSRVFPDMTKKTPPPCPKKTPSEGVHNGQTS